MGHIHSSAICTHCSEMGIRSVPTPGITNQRAARTNIDGLECLWDEHFLEQTTEITSEWVYENEPLEIVDAEYVELRLDNVEVSSPDGQREGLVALSVMLSNLLVRISEQQKYIDAAACRTFYLETQLKEKDEQLKLLINPKRKTFSWLGKWFRSKV